MTTPDFYLIVAAELEWVEAPATFPEVVKLADQPDAVAIYRCCPSDGILRDVTEDLAHEWWAANGVDDFERTPALFRQFLQDKIEAMTERYIDGPQVPDSAWEDR